MTRIATVSRTRRSLASAAMAGLALFALAGCSSEPSTAQTVAEQLPDLSADGLERFDCGTGVIIGDQFIAPDAPHVAECWRGAPDAPFTQLAPTIGVRVVQATGGLEVSAEACAVDVLNAQEGIACRAVYVGEEGNDVLVRILVTLADIDAVISQLPAEGATSDQVIAALANAEVEVLVGTEPVPTASASPSA